MNFEALLAWMAHVGGGSWAAFRRAVVYFAEDDANGNGNADAEVRRARRVLSDLGYADFFVDGGGSWRAFAPVLGVVHDGEAILCGARNLRLVEEIVNACERTGCEIRVEDVANAPPLVAGSGDKQSLLAAADAAGLRFVPDLPRLLAAQLVPIPSMIETAELSDSPINWSHSAFDLHALSWSEEAVMPTAHAYQSKYGAQQHFVDVPGRGLVELDRDSAVYAAAFVNSLDLIEYDGSTCLLSVPGAAPLPAPYARAAALCSARPSAVADGRRSYSRVPPEIAAVIRVASGGRYPGSPRWVRGRPLGSR